MKRLSVIVPVYNAERFLHNSIESILEQSFEGLEIILINDGSSDNSGEICDSLAKKNSIIRVFHQENQGVSAARNVGIENARYEWMYFMDSDDLLIDGIFRFLLKFNDADIDCVCFGAKISKENCEDIFWQTDHTGYFALADALFKHYSLNKYNLWLFFFKSEVIIQNNLKFSENVKYAEDLEFVIKILVLSRGIFLSAEVYYNYFVRAQSAMTSKIGYRRISDHLLVGANLVNFFLLHKVNGEFANSRVEYMVKSYFSTAAKLNFFSIRFSDLQENYNAFYNEYLRGTVFNNLIFRFCRMSILPYIVLIKIKESIYGINKN